MNVLKKIFTRASAKTNDLMAGFAAKRGFALLDSGDIRGALDCFAAYPAARQKRNGDGYTPLESLLYAEKWDFAQSYLDYFINDAKTVNKDGQTLLMQYAAIEKTRAVDLLLAHGAPVDAQDKFGNTALHYTMHNELDADMLPFSRDLIRYGAKADIPNAEGITPLMLAAENAGLGAFVALLLAEKADPARRDKNGLTAGMHAVKEFAFANAEALQYIDLSHAEVQSALTACKSSHPYALGLKAELEKRNTQELHDNARRISSAMQAGSGKACGIKTVTFKKRATGG